MYLLLFKIPRYEGEKEKRVETNQNALLFFKMVSKIFVLLSNFVCVLWLSSNFIIYASFLCTKLGEKEDASDVVLQTAMSPSFGNKEGSKKAHESAKVYCMCFCFAPLLSFTTYVNVQCAMIVSTPAVKDSAQPT